MAILPESLVNKIMTYVSHPVADVFKAHVSVMPGVMENNPDVITIGIHDGNHMYADNMWFTKEHECKHYSDKMEEFVVLNILKSKFTKLITYDTFALPLFARTDYVFRNLDPMFMHSYNVVDVFAHNYEKLHRSIAGTEEEYEKHRREFVMHKFNIYCDNIRPL